MIKAKSILYFDKFLFPNGDSKPKYLIVLNELGDTVLLCNLPSSQNYFNLKINESKCHYVDHGVKGEDHCFCFKAKEEIGENGFNFPLDTFCFFTRSVFEADINVLSKRNPKVLDCLSDHFYYELLYCICKGKGIPTKYIPDLEKKVEDYYNA